MIKMKKKLTILVWLLLFQFSSLFSQSNDNQILFDKFILLFPEKECDFKALWDFNKRTNFEVPLNKIPSDFINKFICSQGIDCKSDYCDDSKYFGFSALGRFSFSSQFYLVLFTIDTDAGCDEKWYLVTYSLNGVLIDKILFFGKTYLMLPTKDNSDRIHVKFEGQLKNMSVIVMSKEYTYKNKIQSIKEKTFNYIIDDHGIFKEL